MLAPIQIGRHRINRPLFLAPMAGVTDLPFRKLCHRLGAGVSVGEMISANPDLVGSRKSRLRLSHDGETEPRIIQIAGGDPETLALSALTNETAGAQIIDINMGCPAKKVLKKSAGSALMQDELLVAAILKATVNAVSIPVTLKIRTGWSADQKNAINIARIAEQEGIQALTIHGRTREDKFTGSAEYDTIAEVKQQISIPVIANGDICSGQDAARVLGYTGADGLMIGRAAQGNPWIFRQISHFLTHRQELPPPRLNDVWQVMTDHLRHLHQFYGDIQGVRVARKHIAWYLNTHMQNKHFLQKFFQLERPHQQVHALNQFFENSQESLNDQYLNRICIPV